MRVMGMSGPGTLAWPPTVQAMPNGPPQGLATATPARREDRAPSRYRQNRLQG